MLPPKQIRFLVLDDEEVFCTRLSESIRKRGYEAVPILDPASALETARRTTFTHAILDLNMPGMQGLAVLKQLIDLQPHIQVLILTGFGSIASALEAVRLGAVDYLTKPADTEQILRAFTGRTEKELQPGEEYHLPSLNRVEWEHIQRVLHECGGNISKAAEVLKINRRSLQRKLNKFPEPQ